MVIAHYLLSCPSFYSPSSERFTTGIRLFAECQVLYRMQFIGQSAKKNFVECHTRRRMTLGTDPLCQVPNTRHTPTLGKGVFAECQALSEM